MANFLLLKYVFQLHNVPINSLLPRRSLRGAKISASLTTFSVNPCSSSSPGTQGSVGTSVYIPVVYLFIYLYDIGKPFN